MSEDFYERILQNIIGIIMVQHDITDVTVQGPLIIQQEFFERFILRFRIQKILYEFFFFQRKYFLLEYPLTRKV